MYKLTSSSMLQPKSSKTLSPLHFAVEETVSLVIKGAQNYYIGAVSSHFYVVDVPCLVNLFSVRFVLVWRLALLAQCKAQGCWGIS